MKKVILFIAACFIAGMATAQNSRLEKSIKTKTELKEKASKTAKKEAKRMKKEGWKVTAGALPLEKQLDRSYIYELDLDDEMNPLYIIGQGRSIGGSYDAAHIQAMELARIEIAGKIGSEATGLIDNLVGTKQLDNEEAESMVTTMEEWKTIVSQKLGRVTIAVDCFRELSDKNKEVQIRLVTSEAQVRKIARDTIREKLEKELKARGKEMSEELKQLLSAK